ncbi:MAG: SRPBCC family protein [Acidimicrobiales bacterium]
MSSFTTTVAVSERPEEVFEAIRYVRGWWSGRLEGATSDVGDEFTYEVPEIHWCKFRITEVDPPRKMSWLVLDSWLTFTDVKDEWTGTTVTFDVFEQDGLTQVRFTHEGLTPEFECYELCSNAWTGYVTGSLRHLITTGVGEPNPAG